MNNIKLTIEEIASIAYRLGRHLNNNFYSYCRLMDTELDPNDDVFMSDEDLLEIKNKLKSIL